MKGTARYTLVRSGTPVVTYKKCSCHRVNGMVRRRCLGCGARLVRKPRTRKPRRGTMERVALEHANAAKLADQWTGKVKRAVTLMHYWATRERQLAARLAAGPQPPKPKRERPPLRGIRLRVAPADQEDAAGMGMGTGGDA